MGKYSIKELEQLSGIKAHTIRIWEKRHKLIQPERTQTNIRFYSDEDLKKIINVSVLNNHGLKISKIATLTPDDLNKKVFALAVTQNSTDLYIDQLIVSMVDLDEEKFEQLISSLNLKFGLERMVTEIIYPFLDKIGVLWQTNNITPAQEHFISNLVRQKLIVAIDGLPIPAKNGTRAVLFLPEHELHELGLLFQYYLVKKSGIRTYYLGQGVPHNDLKKVVEDHLPHYLIASLTSHSPIESMQEYVDKLSADFPHIKIFLSGSAIRKSDLRCPSGITILDKALKLRELLTRS